MYLILVKDNVHYLSPWESIILSSRYRIGSFSNSVCSLFGVSMGLHLRTLQTISSRLVQLRDGPVFDRRPPASCVFRAPRL